MRDKLAVVYPASMVDSVVVHADMEAAAPLRRSLRAAGAGLQESIRLNCLIEIVMLVAMMVFVTPVSAACAKAPPEAIVDIQDLAPALNRAKTAITKFYIQNKRLPSQSDSDVLVGMLPPIVARFVGPGILEILLFRPDIRTHGSDCAVALHLIADKTKNGKSLDFRFIHNEDVQEQYKAELSSVHCELQTGFDIQKLARMRSSFNSGKSEANTTLYFESDGINRKYVSTDPFQAKEADEICTGKIYDAVGRFLGIDNFIPRNRDGVIVSESCKSWPYKSDSVLSAFAFDKGVEYEKSLIVAVLDKKSMRIVSSLQSTISEDAITEAGENSLRLDTAKYQLAKGVRAFGLRFSSAARGASCGEANWNDELTLLIPEGRQLRAVLNLYMYQQQSIQGCLSAQVPDAIWQDANLTINIEKSSTNGFYDLRARAMITDSSNGAPLENLKDHVEQHVLRYDGKSYVKGANAPWWLGY